MAADSQNSGCLAAALLADYSIANNLVVDNTAVDNTVADSIAVGGLAADSFAAGHFVDRSYLSAALDNSLGYLLADTAADTDCRCFGTAAVGLLGLNSKAVVGAAPVSGNIRCRRAIPAMAFGRFPCS